MNIPTPKISSVSAITMASTNLENSLAYYQKLGFAEVQRFDMPFPWIQISDGALLIMLRLDKKPYIALTYYVTEIEKIAGELEAAGISFSDKPAGTDMIKRYFFKSPDGLNISLVSNIDDFFKQPAGPTLLKMPQQDYFIPSKYPNQVCGLFGEFAHAVENLENSLTWWEKLGFSMISRFGSPYPWAIISDGIAVVGLHQTKDFPYPAITYFAADMKDKIATLVSNGLENYTERGNASNIVVTTPEQQHIFLFNLGM